MGDKPDLIDVLYASTIDPHRYDELMSCWQAHVDETLALSDTDITADLAIGEDEIVRHFNRAFAILERLGRTGAETHSFGGLLVGERPTLLIEPSGRIVAVNGPARALFGVSSGDPLDILNLEATGLANIREALSRIAEEQPGRLLTITRALSPSDGSTPIVALSRASTAGNSRVLAVLSVADMEWSNRVGDLLREVFGLTATECDITRGIITGLSPEKLAEIRGRSEQTVRTQTKAVLRKLSVRTQAELVRMVAGLMQMDAAPEPDSPAVAGDGDGRSTLILRRGRPLDVVTIGPTNGRPVLFIHGMLDGHGVTHWGRALLQSRGIRMICPVRPNFGRSGADGDAARAPKRFAEDLAAVMDHFGIAACPVIGHMAGSVYAFAAAAHLQARITHIICISGGVPIVSTAQFSVMSPRQRIVAHTARFAPRLLPLILRVGIALLDGGGDRAFMEALYHTGSVDFEVASDPEVFSLLREGYTFAVTQGHRAFEIDASHVVSDWSGFAERSSQRVLLLHGLHDPVVKIQTVRGFFEHLGDRTTLIEHPGQGQLVFYGAPDFVIDGVETALQQP